MTETAPEIDYDRIDYPSDEVTLKQLRTRNVELTLDGEAIEDMHDWEKEFARIGFLRELGNTKELDALVAEMDTIAHADVGVSPLEHLSSCYVRFGIADGSETARQLIRRLESQGSEQAKQGPGRPPF